MARIRTIKPEFWSDDRILELSLLARLFFIGLWNFADDTGNIDRSPKQLKARIFPGDLIDVEPLIQELIEQRLMVEYVVAGKTYLHIRNFDRHQRINRPSAPTCPPFQGTLIDDSLNAHGVGVEPSPPEGKGKEGKGKEEDITSVAENIEEPPSDDSPPPEDSPEESFSLLESLPVKDGSFYQPTLPQMEELRRLYPSRDIEHEFRKMRGWLLSNPKRRKTLAGMPRFINSWLSDEPTLRFPQRTQSRLSGLGQINHDQGIGADGRF